jgi:hypothetical protein
MSRLANRVNIDLWKLWQRRLQASSDIDVLVVVDSLRYCKKDLISLMKILENCKAKFHVGMDMDIILDSEIDLWNNGIFSDGHHFSHLSTNCNKDAKVIFGEDIRRRFRLLSDFEEKARLNLENIEAEYLTWVLHYYHYHPKDDPYYESVPYYKSVPYYMTYCLLTTFLNAHGIVEITGFDEMCQYVDRFPSVAETSSFKKFRKAKGTELTDDEFMNLLRIVKTATPKRP